MTTDAPGRFHLTLTAVGRPVAHGWWDGEATARDKLKGWIRDWGRPGAHITLTDELTGETLTTWPDAE